MRRASIVLAACVLAVGSAAPTVAGADAPAPARPHGLDVDARTDLTYRTVGGALAMGALVVASRNRRRRVRY
jgi:hypothetical protein